jgi:tetratricopeptide (TPR) repeat protein
MQEFFVKRKIQKYEVKREAHADNPEFLEELAGLYQKLSRREKAIECYQCAIEAYYREDSRLGVDNEFILGVCWHLLELDPLNLLAHQTLGQEFCGLGEFEEAVHVYKSFALKLARAGRYEDAIAQYRHAFVLVSDDIKGRQQCFSLLWKLRRKEEAVQELRKIADIAEHKGAIAKAVECYQKALKIYPSNPELRAALRRLVQVHRQENNQLRLVVNNDV